jgi:hypothetical protein
MHVFMSLQATLIRLLCLVAMLGGAEVAFAQLPGGGTGDTQPTLCPLPGSSYDGSQWCVLGPSAQGFSYYVSNRSWYTRTCKAGAFITDIVVGRSSMCLDGVIYREVCQDPDGTTYPPKCFTGTPEFNSNTSTSCYQRTNISQCRIATAPTYSSSVGSWQAAAHVLDGKMVYTPNNGTPVVVAGQLRPAGVLATIYVHGRANGPQRGWDYWENFTHGAYPLWLAWDSRQLLNSQAATFDTFMDQACTGGNPCQLVCHSAGCLLTTFRLAQNPGRWNVLNVTSVMGAQGGSPLAIASTKIQHNMGWIERMPVANFIASKLQSWYGLYPIDNDLQPAVARGMYNHNMGGVPITTVTGDWYLTTHDCKWYQFACQAANIGKTTINSLITSIYKGGSDGVVPYHSSSGFNAAVGSPNSCPPSGYAYFTNYSSVHNQPTTPCGRAPNVFHTDNKEMRSRMNAVPPTSVR